jgi:hypothetical protein
LYRRVLIWTVGLLLVAWLTIYSSGGLGPTTAADMLDFVDFGKGNYWSGVIGVKKPVKASGKSISQEGDGDVRVAAAPLSTTNPPHWLKYPQ